MNETEVYKAVLKILQENKFNAPNETFYEASGSAEDLAKQIAAALCSPTGTLDVSGSPGGT